MEKFFFVFLALHEPVNQTSKTTTPNIWDCQCSDNADRCMRRPSLAQCDGWLPIRSVSVPGLSSYQLIFGQDTEAPWSKEVLKKDTAFTFDYPVLCLLQKSESKLGNNEKLFQQSFPLVMCDWNVGFWGQCSWRIFSPFPIHYSSMTWPQRLHIFQVASSGL